MKMKPYLALSIASILWLLPYSAKCELRETYTYKGNPTRNLIDKWIASGQEKNKRSYQVELFSPNAYVLETLSRLTPAANELQVQVAAYPSLTIPGPLMEAWQKLAQSGAILVVKNSILPTPNQVEALNKIGFKKMQLRIQYMPTANQASALKNLSGEYQVKFEMKRFPLFHDKPNLMEIPKKVSLYFPTDYWPGYSHMDLFNLIPHPVVLEIHAGFPSLQQLEYLKHIHRLEKLVYETDALNMDEMRWRMLGDQLVHWVARNYVPAESSVAAFARVEFKEKKLILYWEEPLNEAQRTYLEKSGIEVMWIHGAPE